MTYPTYIREKALQMRLERKLTVNEIAERLGIAKSTIFYWVGDLPLAAPGAPPLASASGT